jgi:hypothetical protein
METHCWKWRVSLKKDYEIGKQSIHFGTRTSLVLVFLQVSEIFAGMISSRLTISNLVINKFTRGSTWVAVSQISKEPKEKFRSPTNTTKLF